MKKINQISTKQSNKNSYYRIAVKYDCPYIAQRNGGNRTDNLFEKPKVYKNKPRKSNKFGAISLYYDGVYYFPSDIKESDKRENKPFEIQGVYYRGKWHQDTFYITNEFKEFLLNAL